MNSPVRVVVLTTIAETMAAFFPRQLRALVEAGFDVHAVSSPGEVLAGLGEQSGVATHGVAMERRPHPLRDGVAVARLTRLLRELRPQVVHAHTPKAGLLGMTAARLAGAPVRLYTVHGLPLMTRTGPWRRVLEAAERASAALATHVYCVSESLRREVVWRGLCPPEKVSVLGHGSCAGVDVVRFQPPADAAGQRAATRAALGIPQSAALATFIGRLAKDKGIAVLAEAWSVIRGRREDVCLLLAGEEDATDPVAPGALAALRSDPRVFWTGNVPLEHVPALLNATDVCVLPTFREGLGQVMLEAGAMGVAVVASRTCGVVDAVQDGVTGLLIPPRDAQALAEAILRLVSDVELRHTLGEAAMRHVRARFAEDRVNDLWIAEYRRWTMPDVAVAEVRQTVAS